MNRARAPSHLRLPGIYRSPRLAAAVALVVVLSGLSVAGILRLQQVRTHAQAVDRLALRIQDRVDSMEGLLGQLIVVIRTPGATTAEIPIAQASQRQRELDQLLDGLEAVDPSSSALATDGRRFAETVVRTLTDVARDGGHPSLTGVAGDIYPLFSTLQGEIADKVNRAEIAARTADRQALYGSAVLVGSLIALVIAGAWYLARERVVRQAEMVERQVRAAQELQHALLPPALPRLPGVSATARYVPASGDAVGGDWYDLIALPRGGIGLVMGDVEGHSVTAAAIMGQVRNVLRAYAEMGAGPAELLTRVDRFVSANTDVLITCCYAELQPSSRIVTTVCAGHPPPVVIDGAQPSWQLPVPPGLPLGVDPGQLYSEHTTELPEGCGLLLFTDGLVDDDARAPHQGVDAFMAAAQGMSTLGLDALADGLVEGLQRMSDIRDDAALLVVRLTGAGAGARGPGGVSRVFEPTPAATPAARHFVRDVLGAWSMEELHDTAALLVSELVTNVVIHTASEARLTLRRSGEHAVRIGVHDDNDRLPQRNKASVEDISGRGLAIVEQVADAWWIDPDPGGGKTVWAEVSHMI